MRLPILFLALTVCFGIQNANVGPLTSVAHAQQAAVPQVDDADPAAPTESAANADSEEVASGADVAVVASDPSGNVATAGPPKIIPVALLVIGIVAVLGMIIGLKLNAFLALILSALIVSLGVGWVNGEDAGTRMNQVVQRFGATAGGIGIVIAMAAIIGKCMLDSGAADRIVRSAVRVTGEKRAALGLMVSGFVLAIPVFFDTVFYLLVPLARSLYRRTNQNYLRYLMAIATGGAITHTLVPPTPGPLLVSAILGVEIGTMMLIGTLVAIPAATVGLIYSIVADKLMPVEMRPLGAHDDKHKTLSEAQLPRLWVSLLPVLLPVVLIGAGTLAETVADREDRARLVADDILDFDVLSQTLAQSSPASPAGRVMSSSRVSDADRQRLGKPPQTDEEKVAVLEILNNVLLDGSLYDEQAFMGVAVSDLAKSKLSADQLRMKPVDRRRMNRALLEDAYPQLIGKHQWNTPKRLIANRLSLWGNANFALMLAAICAMLTLKVVRKLSWRSLGDDVEDALMSGGVIILITSAGGAFGAMLQDTKIGDTIQDYFSGTETSGIALLLIAWGIAAVLKIAQGSSTVAMIVGAGMMAAIIGEAKPEFHMVYVAIAVGTGSLFGSWMNDSGFWVFTKMGGLTEGESLRSWTPLLIVLSVVGLGVTILLSQSLPLEAGL